MKSPITTHVLDTARGCPAGGIAVTLQTYNASGEWQEIGNGTTNDDGRIGDLLSAEHAFEKGAYRLTFFVAAYFRTLGEKSFYPQITVTFEIENPSQHYHVPLLLSPFGYSTYRGS